MASGLYLAFTHPKDEVSEARFNEWYDEHHIPEILALDGITSASRYRSLDSAASHGYLASYTLEGPDLRAIVERIHAAAPNRTPTATMRTNPGTDFRLFEFVTSHGAD